MLEGRRRCESAHLGVTPNGAAAGARCAIGGHGAARHGAARHGAARHGAARHGAARHGAAAAKAPPLAELLAVRIHLLQKPRGAGEHHSLLLVDRGAPRVM
jgi:hypothetical protein